MQETIRKSFIKMDKKILKQYLMFKNLFTSFQETE